MLQVSSGKEELTVLGLYIDPAVEVALETKTDELRYLEYRRLMRVAFYDSLGRRPPTAPQHLPSYVRAVKKKWKLQFNNSARRLLATIEGYDSWEDALSAS